MLIVLASGHCLAASYVRVAIARLIDPPCADSSQALARLRGPVFALLPSSMLALVLGLMFGERMVRALFWIAT